MVDVTSYFGKGQNSQRVGKSSQPTRLKRKADAPEFIDLDKDDDIEEPQSLKRPRDNVEAKQERRTVDHPKRRASKTGCQKMGSPNESPKIPKNQRKTSLNVHDVLENIPSVDLSGVHVKENVSRFGGTKTSDDAGDLKNVVGFPEGKPNCLLGLTMVFTGVLPSLERSQAEGLAKRYGARVTKSISSKTSVVVLGDEAGPKKVENIKKLGVKAIDENGFKQLIEGMPAEGGDGAAAEKARQKLEQQQQQAILDAETIAKEEDERAKRIASAKKSGQNMKSSHMVDDKNKLWTDKYAPTSLQQMCGNKGSINKLKNWLINWEQSKKDGFKNAGRDGTGIFRAALLYGPPGIGKTTAAHLVSEELGYDILERNASDVRSKSLLNAGVKNALDNTSVVGYFKKKEQEQESNCDKFVIIMDEVDGMSGGDRGGVGQLAQFCRKTATPMILICNERNLPKMRAFDRVCLDIQFRRPDANSVKARLMTIAIREKFKLDPNIIDSLLQATNADIRQIINLLSAVSKTSKSIGHENVADIMAAWQKNIALKPFDITHKLLDGRYYTDAGSQSFTLNDKIALYFDDFDFAPLMIQENYLSTRPSNLMPGKSHIAAVADAAESISYSNLVEAKIRSSEQLWSLLPLHAVVSSVYPSSKVAGHMSGRINFTSWLGQNSKSGKYYRLLQGLQYHTRLSTSTDKMGLRLDYMPTFKRRLLNPILKNGAEGIPPVIELMDAYYLTREDWDTIMEFQVGPDAADAQLKKIPTSVKTAFTRRYNSTTHPVAIYRTGTTTAVTAGSTIKPDFEDIVDADDGAPPADEDEIKEDEDLKKDKLIKQKAKPTKRKPRATNAGATKKRKTK